MILPSEATECYSPWHSPESQASAAATKAFHLELNYPSVGCCQAQHEVVRLSAGCLSPGNPLRVGNAPPQEG